MHSALLESSIFKLIYHHSIRVEAEISETDNSKLEQLKLNCQYGQIPLDAFLLFE